MGYEDFVFKAQYQEIIPAIYLKSLPIDYATIIEDEDRRNQLFMKIIAPLGIRVNNEILKEREELEVMITDFDENGELTPAQEKRIEELAVKYDQFTRLKGYRRYKLLLGELRVKIDIIPTSFYIAVAAAETNWGSSRIVRDAHSLYKELVWFTNDGLKPADETEDDSYRIKIFPSLYDSMKSFALRLNSSVDYPGFRRQRKEWRYRRQLMTGRGMAHTLPFFSPMKNYIGMIDYISTFYEMYYLDSAKLYYPEKKDITKHTSR